MYNYRRRLIGEKIILTLLNITKILKLVYTLLIWSNISIKSKINRLISLRKKSKCEDKAEITNDVQINYDLIETLNDKFDKAKGDFKISPVLMTSKHSKALESFYRKISQNMQDKTNELKRRALLVLKSRLKFRMNSIQKQAISEIDMLKYSFLVILSKIIYYTFIISKAYINYLISADLNNFSSKLHVY